MSQHLINEYLSELANLKRVSGSKRESVVREAFKDLLKKWGKSKDLTFIPEHEFQTPTKTRVYVDGALMHDLRVPHGYWEAKDEHDDLDDEIKKKFRKGYPKTNIIFEDTREAVLFQNGVETLRAKMDGDDLHGLLERFFDYERPEIENFRKAIEQFKKDLPEVLKALRQRIDEAYTSNAAFKTAADDFLKHAKQTINPSVTDSDVREMLIQHILTEDIFARVFGNSDFHRENNVAKALYGLEAKFFRGEVKQKTLDVLRPYYTAIRSTAELISNHSEKQGFLKAIYENFYKVYNPKAADRLGVIYTPNEIVRFMVKSADWLCEKHFERSLADKNVEILDPATGTGTFVVELLEHFRGQPAKLRHKYAEELHANEVAILPYYVANLNIEATYAAITGEYKEFPSLCFVDTLDNVGALGIYSGHQHDLFGGFSDINIERVRRQNQRKISVIIGNPPYNAWQENFNQRNPNRPYQRVDERIARTYVKAGSAQNQSSVYDMYTRFVRWASDRIRDDGIVAFVIGRKPISKSAYDGFRRIAGEEFAEILIVDLGGDVVDNPKLSGTKHNVFGIKMGVAIVFLIKKKGVKGPLIKYFRRPEDEEREDKLSFLGSRDASSCKFERIEPDVDGSWISQIENEWDSLLPIADHKVSRSPRTVKDVAIFRVMSNGLQTKRDDWVYSHDRKTLEKKVRELVDRYEGARRKTRAAEANEIKWDRELTRHLRRGTAVAFNPAKITTSVYRPFSNRLVYFDDVLNSQVFRLQELFPPNGDNVVINVGSAKRAGVGVLAMDRLPTTDMFIPDVGLCYARYRYTDAGERLDNITDWSLAKFKAHYGASEPITKNNIFSYAYAVLHDPIYRETYALNLKREVPRIPFYPNFKLWSDWGQELLDLHIGYEKVEPLQLKRVDTPDLAARAAKEPPEPKLKSDHEGGVITLDTETTLSGVPSVAWRYVLGNRCAIDWVLDQHKEKTPRDPTIREKFNTYRFADHKEHVVDLLKRVTTVSVRTVAITDAMRDAKRD